MRNTVIAAPAQQAAGFTPRIAEPEVLCRRSLYTNLVALSEVVLQPDPCAGNSIFYLLWRLVYQGLPSSRASGSRQPPTGGAQASH